MFKRLKQTMVESYVGAIALGWLFAQGVLHFAYIFAAPVAGWASRRTYLSLGILGHSTPVQGLLFRDALPELARAFFLLLLWYLLLRWLYFKPVAKGGDGGPPILERPV